WSPLGGNPGADGNKKSNVLEDSTINELAKKYGKSPAQIIIRWNIENKVIVLPKSATPARIKENFNVFDFSLTKDEIAKIDGLTTNKRPSTNPDEFHLNF
ncbi:MAG: aldo/keto reductase, partial [Defluviitaleaceae bacterium]|nr:aldo/keto reductase [Defluviitaleaceae bacterium]